MTSIWILFPSLRPPFSCHFLIDHLTVSCCRLAVAQPTLHTFATTGSVSVLIGELTSQWTTSFLPLHPSSSRPLLLLLLRQCELAQELYIRSSLAKIDEMGEDCLDRPCVFDCVCIGWISISMRCMLHVHLRSVDAAPCPPSSSSSSLSRRSFIRSILVSKVHIPRVSFIEVAAPARQYQCHC